MIVERLPEVLALSTEEKEILAEELVNQVVLGQDRDPALVDLLRRRLTDHATDPAAGLHWETLRDRLLKRQHVRHRRIRPGEPEILWKQGAENPESFRGSKSLPSLKNTAKETACDLLASLISLSVMFECIRRWRQCLKNRSHGWSSVRRAMACFYSVEPRGIIVHALIHLSRDPERIRDRIRRLLGFG